ncbi:MAG: hypothetical protein KKD39_00495 [Candidatus Altiarchaeota archaeon]|nr:hypothetical protein [Candidatus Altiarchaeota archaeon]
MESLFFVLLASFSFTYLAVPWFVPRLLKAGIYGKDINKKSKAEIPEMGGLAIIGGFLVGVLLAIGFATFNVFDVSFDLALVLAGLSVVLVMGLIGVIDDLLLINQKVKAFLPLFAALPLVAVKAGVTSMDIPFLGNVNFGILYPLLLVPLAINGASNATNMLAGFNGLEAGLGVIMCSTIGFVAYALGKPEAVIISFALLGALLAFLRYNGYPSKVFIGDVGTLSIGAVVAVSVILGNIEKAGMILFVPYFLELFLKARGRFKKPAWGILKAGKLYCMRRKDIYGMSNLVMHIFGGVSERNLVFTIWLVESLFSAIVLCSYFGPRIF